MLRKNETGGIWTVEQMELARVACLLDGLWATESRILGTEAAGKFSTGSIGVGWQRPWTWLS